MQNYACNNYYRIQNSTRWYTVYIHGWRINTFFFINPAYFLLFKSCFSGYPYLGKRSVYFKHYEHSKNLIVENEPFGSTRTFFLLCSRNMTCFWPLGYEELHDHAKLHLPLNIIYLSIIHTQTQTHMSIKHVSPPSRPRQRSRIEKKKQRDRVQLCHDFRGVPMGQTRVTCINITDNI